MHKCERLLECMYKCGLGGSVGDCVSACMSVNDCVSAYMSVSDYVSACIMYEMYECE